MTPMKHIALKIMDWRDRPSSRHAPRTAANHEPCHASETEMITEPKVAIKTIDWWDSSCAPAALRNPVACPLSPLPHTNPIRVSGLPALHSTPPRRPSSCLAPPPPCAHPAANPAPCHASETGTIIESEIYRKTIAGTTITGIGRPLKSVKALVQ